MRIAVHDYAGHAFTMELSRELARRGHHVLHVYSPDVIGTKGALTSQDGDPPTLSVRPATIGRTFDKYSPVRRFRDERAYGRAAAACIRAFNPRVVLSANTPLLSQARLLSEARRGRRRFVYWWQDSYGIGARRVASRRFPVLAPVAAMPFEMLERRMLEGSDHVVAIAEALRHQARRQGVDGRQVSVIPNWAPVNEVVPAPSENSWKAAHGLAGTPLVVYSGALRLKHDPELLVLLAARLSGSGARVVVASQGPGREVLERRRRQLGLANLVLVDYQPHEQFGSMLAAADVLVAMTEPDAAAFSLPPMILSYLCAGRAVVASIPAENQAAEVLRAADVGIWVPPGDGDRFVRAVIDLLDDDERRGRLAARGRAYAAANFTIGPIANRFEAVLRGPRSRGRTLGPLGLGAATVARIWSHPENRGRRARAVAAYGAWQVWERTVRRPWTVPLTATRRIRCYPHCPATAAVLYYRLPDAAEMRFLLDFLGDGDVFLDVGAHVGVYAVLASSVPGVRVVAVEPSSESYDRLVENVRLNDVDDRVTTLRAAASDHHGRATLTTGRGVMNTLVGEDDEGEPVELFTVDDLLTPLDIPALAAVKIDVEGFELDVLAGAAGMLERSRPALVVEVNDPEGIASFAKHNDYTVVRYEGDGSLMPTSIESCDGGNALLVGDLDEVRRRLQG